MFKFIRWTLYKVLFIQLLFICPRVGYGQKFRPNYIIKEELKYRSGKPYKEEKYYKNGLLDSVYRQWNSKGKKLTEGYYFKGQRHGQWWEWLSEYQRHDYLLYTYDHGTLRKLYTYAGWLEGQDSVKRGEHFYVFQPDTNNYKECFILWDPQLKGKNKSEEKNRVVRNRIIVEEKIKRWDKGIPWEEEHTKTLYDKNGQSLGHRKHGHWRLWNEDGTLQRETWYNMGQKLREKLYDHGKLVSDKKY